MNKMIVSYKVKIGKKWTNWYKCQFKTEKEAFKYGRLLIMLNFNNIMISYERVK